MSLQVASGLESQSATRELIVDRSELASATALLGSRPVRAFRSGELAGASITLPANAIATSIGQPL